MGILDLFKVAKDLLMGEDYTARNHSERYANNLSASTDDEDRDGEEEENDEDEEVEISQRDVKRIENALSKFYSRLTEKEQDDKLLNKMIEEVQDGFFDGKNMDNPQKALDDTYQKWKATRGEYKKKMQNGRQQALDMLRRFDTLSEDERESLVDANSPSAVSRLKKSDSKAVAEIVESWFKDGSIDEERYRIIEEMSHSDAEEWYPDIHQYFADNAPLTPKNYRIAKLAFTNATDLQDLYYEEYAEYIKRYWLKSGIVPQPIDCDDLIVNRPCYFHAVMNLCTPRFHLGKRWFEGENSKQEVQIYLFADKLEYITLAGHYTIDITDIIDISTNDWSLNKSRSEEIQEWKYREKHGESNNNPCPEPPEPDLLEITCRNQNKVLLDWTDEAVDVLELRGLLFYFIKNPIS